MENLNEIQKAAVECINGTSMILAGAGSGKTRVLTYKIANLIKSGISPNRILALTFTNKAAKEMKDRVRNLVGDDAQYIKMGTFHSIFCQILRCEARATELDPCFSIYDDSDSKSIIKDIIKELDFDKDTYKASNILARIGIAKNNLIDSKTYCDNQQFFENDLKNKMQYFGDIYKRYEKKLHLANALDFDDLLLYTYILFRDNEAIRAYYEDEFEAVLVDEFQDTNTAQMQILLQLTNDKQNLTVVGDDAQSIYSFRGANINNILTFNQYFPNAKIFKLGQNYRSTQTIVAAANSLIHKNLEQIDKEVWSQGEFGDKIHELQFNNPTSEAQYIALSIKEIIRYEKCNLADIAILFRNNALCHSVEAELINNNIPYILHNGIPFFKRHDIKNIMAIFKFLCNIADDIAFETALAFPPKGIGKNTIDTIKMEAEKNNVFMFAIANEPDRYDLQVNKGIKKKLKEFCKVVEKMICYIPEHDAADAANYIMEQMNIYEYVDTNKENSTSKMGDVNELLDSILEFVEARKQENRNEEIYLSNYLQDVTLDMNQMNEQQGDAVNLMTIHAAKGLEYNTVYIIGCEENIFPSERSSSNPMQLEEERRLAYVAITRAEKHCYITSCKERCYYGDYKSNPPSRFIEDIDKKYIEHIDPYRDDDDENEETQGFFD